MVARLGLMAVLASMLFSWPVQSANLKGNRAGRSASMGMGIPDNNGIHSVSKSLKYLIASFPKIKTVAYTHLPDTIWRPLFLGTVANPSGVVADPLNGRLFVADSDLKRIFWYQLIIEKDGLLKTDGQQHVAVDNVQAKWLAVDGLGDLYFTGQMIVEAPYSSYRSVYRMDESKISLGNAMNPVEVYSRSNTGFPTPAVWMPSGIGVDSFDIYWGNQEKGKTNGAVCTGTRQNIGVVSANLEVNIIDQAIDEVRGVSVAGESIFFLGPEGVYGMAKGVDGTVTNSETGLIQASSVADGWDPVGLAFDGENTMYWTETKAGVIYSFPAADTNPHPLIKYIDAPLVDQVTVFAMTGELKSQAIKDYGMLSATRSQSSAKAEESGAHSVWRLSLLAAVLSALAMLVSC